MPILEQIALNIKTQSLKIDISRDLDVVLIIVFTVLTLILKIATIALTHVRDNQKAQKLVQVSARTNNFLLSTYTIYAVSSAVLMSTCLISSSRTIFKYYKSGMNMNDIYLRKTTSCIVMTVGCFLILQKIFEMTIGRIRKFLAASVCTFVLIWLFVIVFTSKSVLLTAFLPLLILSYGLK